MSLVILDSGHNEYVKGKCNGDFKEWDFNNKMQYKIKKRLENHGIEVFLTNPNPEKKDEIGLSKRSALANDYWAKKNKPKAIFISLHGNAFSNSTARGTETYHATNASATSKTFAKTLNDEVVKTMQSLDKNAKNRGVKSQDFTVIYKASMPSVLVEYGFYSNPEDLKILKNNQDDLTEATVKAICKYFNITYKAVQKETTSSSNTSTGKQLYAVCIGAYEYNTAKKMEAEMKSKGYTSTYLIPR